jgi:hypothetical protein
MVSARAAFTVSVTGLTSAKACTAPGMDDVGTNAEEAKVSGKTQMNPTDWAVSGSRTFGATATQGPAVGESLPIPSRCSSISRSEK